MPGNVAKMVSEWNWSLPEGALPVLGAGWLTKGAAGGSGGNVAVTIWHFGFRRTRFQAREKRIATGLWTRCNTSSSTFTETKLVWFFLISLEPVSKKRAIPKEAD